MDRSLAHRTLALVALTFHVTGCGVESGGCTLIGCVDAFVTTFRMDSSAVPAGEHAVEVAADGASTRCVFTFPPANPNPTPGACTSARATLFVSPQVTCRDVMMGGAVSHTCDPIPGRYEVRLAVQGTPMTVRTTYRAGGRALFDREVVPAYTVSRPNGPNCEPVCRSYSATIDLP